MCYRWLSNLAIYVCFNYVFDFFYCPFSNKNFMQPRCMERVGMEPFVSCINKIEDEIVNILNVRVCVKNIQLLMYSVTYTLYVYVLRWHACRAVMCVRMLRYIPLCRCAEVWHRCVRDCVCAFVRMYVACYSVHGYAQPLQSYCTGEFERLVSAYYCETLSKRNQQKQ